MATHFDDLKDFDARSEPAQAHGVAMFFEEPMAKALIAQIPASDNSEVLKALIESAFRQGFKAGSTFLAADIMAGGFKGGRR